MKTSNNNKPGICEGCHIEMQPKPDAVNFLDINRISLLSMFRINEFHVFQCPCCNRVSLRI